MIDSEDMATDWSLAERAKTGDVASFAALMERYQKPVYHYCFRMLWQAQDAEDAAQETFVRLYRHLANIAPKEGAKFSTLLFCIARNVTLNQLRYRVRHKESPQHWGGIQTGEVDDRMAQIPGKPTQAPDAEAQAHELGALIQQGMESLSESYREILVLREFQGMDYESMAEVLGCPIGTVRSRLLRAREKLRDWLLTQGVTL